MRIAVVTPSYPPYKGGMGNVAFHFSEALSKRGHDVTVFTPGYTRETRRQRQKSVHFLFPFGKYGNAAFVPQLFFALRGFEVIHAHIPFIGAAKALVLFKLFFPKTRLVIHYHMDLIGRGFTKPLFSCYRMTAVRLLLWMADDIIVTSQDYADTSLLKTYFTKHREKLHIIANGITYAHFSKKVTTNAPNRHIPYVLFVGALDKAHYFKGVSLLINAWGELPSAYKNYNLVIVGDGDERLRYERKAGLTRACDHIHFVGKVSDNDLAAFYQKAALTVLPSLTGSEAFGMVVIESMAANTPVVASSLPGVRTLISHGGNGFLVTPGSLSELTASLKQGIDRSKTIKDTRTLPATARKYDWEKLTTALETVLQG